MTKAHQGDTNRRVFTRSGSGSSVGAMCWNISITHQLARSLVLHGQGNGPLRPTPTAVH